MFFTYEWLWFEQGRISHWSNRANARGLALGYENTPLLVFHSVRLFTMRQNCRAFWLLHLVYRSGKLITLAFIVFEWLKRIEPNSTTLSMTEDLYWKSVHPWTYAKIFLGKRQRPNSAYLFQVVDGAMQMDVHKTLRSNSFYPISLCSLNLHSSSYIWNIFYTSAIRHAFLFINCIISVSWAMSTKKSLFKNDQGPEQHERWKDNVAKLFQAMRSRTVCWQDYRITYLS